MTANKSPAFQFYPSDFLSDAKTATMTAEEIGVYTLLLCYCWIEGSLPAEHTFLSRLARVQQKKFSRLFSAKISACFIFDQNTNRYRHPRLEKERIKQEGYRHQQSEKGKRSAEQRFNRGSTTVQHRFNHGSTLLSSSSSSSTSSDLKKEKRVKKEKALDAPDGSQASLLPLPEKSKPEKLNFGEEGKVKLTAEEYDKLVNKYGAETTKSSISLLNDFIGAKRRDPYASHYHAIKKWVVEAVEAKKGIPKVGTRPWTAVDTVQHNIQVFKTMNEGVTNGQIDASKMLDFFSDGEEVVSD